MLSLDRGTSTRYSHKKTTNYSLELAKKLNISTDNVKLDVYKTSARLPTPVKGGYAVYGPASGTRTPYSAHKGNILPYSQTHHLPLAQYHDVPP